MTALDYKHYKEEKIDGKIYLMSPLANPIHGETIGNLYVAFHPYFKGKNCKVFSDNISVFLDEEKNNYIVPDISVLCDPDKFKKDGYHGVPTLAVEVISHPRVDRDKIYKYNLYEKFGVKEYWIADYVSKSIEQHVLNDGKYSLKTVVSMVTDDVLECLDDEDKAAYTTILKSAVFEGLEVDLKEIF